MADEKKERPLTAAQFTSDPEVVSALRKLKKGRVYSDIIDAQGNQYVDLVMEGGGVLGISLLGYVYALEQAGLRFLGIGGTSAGAINAMMTAAAGTPAEAKSNKVIDVLAALDMASFVDGDDDAKEFVEAFVGDAGRVKLAWKGMQVVDNITDRLGLNPGDVFFEWLKTQLAKFDVIEVRDLEARLAALPELTHRVTGKVISKKAAAPLLAIVAADVTTETKAIFPQMADLYWKRHKSESPAKFVRASMSIPFFFEPFRVGDLPQNAERWEEVGYFGSLPTEVVLVDGGIISNFPIDLFHVPGVPISPTFGAKLGTDRTKPRTIEKPGQLASAVYNASRQYADTDFLAKHPDYRHLITYIETGDHDWLAFSMPNADKVDLFRRGVIAAVAFLNGFDWAGYKKVREALVATTK